MADPGAQVTLRVGNNPYTTVAGNNKGLWEITVTLDDGANTLQATARDDAGNPSPTGSPVILTLDQDPPQVVNAQASPRWQQVSRWVTLSTAVVEPGPLYHSYVWATVAGPDPAARIDFDQKGGVWRERFRAGKNRG